MKPWIIWQTMFIFCDHQLWREGGLVFRRELDLRLNVNGGKMEAKEDVEEAG